MSRCYIGTLIKKYTICRKISDICPQNIRKMCVVSYATTISFRLQTSIGYSNRKIYIVTWCDKVVKGKKQSHATQVLILFFIWCWTNFKCFLKSQFPRCYMIFLIYRQKRLWVFSELWTWKFRKFYLLVLLIFESNNSYHTSWHESLPVSNFKLVASNMHVLKISIIY